MVECAYCTRLHGVIALATCGHSFCEPCWYDPTRLDICAACEVGKAPLTVPRWSLGS